MQEENVNEIWRNVVGYEGIYSVSSLGRIRRDKPGKGRCVVGRIMKTRLTPAGYPIVCLTGSEPCVQKDYAVHKLVAAAFLGPCPIGKEVNHKDGNKSNPRQDNLEYITQKENHEHASRMGLKASGDRHGARLHPETRPRGEASGKSRFTAKQVLDMRVRFAAGKVTAPQLAREHNTSRTVIHGILKRRTWKHI